MEQPSSAGVNTQCVFAARAGGGKILGSPEAVFRGCFRLARQAEYGQHPHVTTELESLFSFLRFASVSTESRHAGDVRNCADWLVKELTSMGLVTELHETPKHPVVVARNKHVGEEEP